MAFPAHYHLLHLIFLIFFFTNFSTIVFANEDAVDPVDLVPSEGRNSFIVNQTKFKLDVKEKMHWAEVDYNVRDQCMVQTDTEQRPPGSYRILFVCSGDADCVDSTLVMCYPSMLDPEAFPDENLDSDVDDNDKDRNNYHLRKPQAHVWIVNDETHKISETCNAMMEKCKADPGCAMPKIAREHGGERWHGFNVTRRKGKFVVGLPFGENGIGKTVTINDTDNSGTPHFYINFGTHDDIGTFIVTGDQKKIRAGTALRNEYYSEKGQEAGMPLEAAAHLWTLGLDLLPTEENNMIRFYTKSITDSASESCTRFENEEGFRKGQNADSEFVFAKFILTNDPNPAVGEKKRQNMIYVDGYKNKIYIEQLDAKRASTQFYVRAKVPIDAKNITIKLNKGRKEPNELGTVSMKITVENLDKAEAYKCEFYVEGNEKKPCNIARGMSFWMWFNAKTGDFSLNCINFEFKSQLGSIFHGKLHGGKTLNLKINIVDDACSTGVKTDENKKEFFNLCGVKFTNLFAMLLLPNEDGSYDVYMDGIKQNQKGIGAAGDANFLQTHGDVIGTKMNLLLMEKKKELHNDMSTEVVGGKFLKSNYIIIHCIILLDNKAKFSVLFKCETCDRIRDPLSLYFNINSPGKSKGIATYLKHEKKTRLKRPVSKTASPPANGISELPKGQPIWIKIGFDSTIENSIVRFNFQNEDFMKIPNNPNVAEDDFYANKILINGDVIVLNTIVPFPHLRKIFKGSAVSTQIVVEGQTLEMAKMFQLFLVDVGEQIEYVNVLGSDYPEVQDIFNDKNNKGKVYMHMIVDLRGDMDKICVSMGNLQNMSSPEDCKGKFNLKVSKFKLEIRLEKAANKATITLNGKEIENLVIDEDTLKSENEKLAALSQFMDCSHFIISGDITLRDIAKITHL